MVCKFLIRTGVVTNEPFSAARRFISLYVVKLWLIRWRNGHALSSLFESLMINHTARLSVSPLAGAVVSIISELSLDQRPGSPKSHLKHSGSSHQTSPSLKGSDSKPSDCYRWTMTEQKASWSVFTSILASWYHNGRSSPPDRQLQNTFRFRKDFRQSTGDIYGTLLYNHHSALSFIGTN